MSTVAEFRVPAAEFLLGTAFDRLGELRVRLESSVSTSLPSMWIRAPGRDPLEDALAADPSIEAFEHLASVDDRLLYDVTCAPEYRRVYETVLEGDGSLLQGAATNGQWRIEMRFRNRSALSRTHERLTDAGVSVEVTRVTDLAGTVSGRSRLTPEQREALSAAFEHGYFEIPRRTSLEELAEELGISHQALSERLRRAYESLVDAELQPAAEQ